MRDDTDVLRRPCLKLLVGAMVAAGSVLLTHSAIADERRPTVDVVTIVDHPALDAFRHGAEDALKASGYEPGVKIGWTFQSAQGNNATAAQIARKFVGEQPDVILAISTPAAQAVVAATRNIPVVYGAVTDPVAAQLVKSMQASGSNVTGVSDRLVPEKQADLIKRLLPSVKKVGMIYNPAEANSVVAVREMKEALSRIGVALIEAAAPRSVDVGQAARRLVGKVDVIYTGTDNNVVAAYEAVVKVGNDAKIPLVAADTGSIRRGAVAALSVNYRDLGNQAGRQIARILKGEQPANMPSETSDKLLLVLNMDAARKQGVEISKQLQSEASEILGR